jgi:hypothetical protein
MLLNLARQRGIGVELPLVLIAIQAVGNLRTAPNMQLSRRAGF